MSLPKTLSAVRTESFSYFYNAFTRSMESPVHSVIMSIGIFLYLKLRSAEQYHVFPLQYRFFYLIEPGGDLCLIEER